MPTYEYECKVCRNKFEFFHGMNADPIKECPNCGGTLEKKISAGTGLLFKGSGFYITDYKNKKSDEKKTDSAKTLKKEKKTTKEKTT
jgi:putative FmdB family regulatory protein